MNRKPYPEYMIGIQRGEPEIVRPYGQPEYKVHHYNSEFSFSRKVALAMLAEKEGYITRSVNEYTELGTVYRVKNAKGKFVWMDDENNVISMKRIGEIFGGL